MIETLFHANALSTPQAFLTSFLIGIGFGAVLERAGFGSSRRLSGIFYFRDMSVLKVMFSAVIVAMIGLAILSSLGYLGPDSIGFLETFYGPQIVGGLLFGLGFVMGGWCPGTAAVGLASGSMDALVFLLGAGIGSFVFNFAYPSLKDFMVNGSQGVVTIYDTLGMGRNIFIMLFTMGGIASFWAAELIEEYNGTGDLVKRRNFLWAFSIILITGALSLFNLPTPSRIGSPTPLTASTGAPTVVPEPAVPAATLLSEIDQGKDHVEPEELADRLMSGDQGLMLVDVRPPVEFSAFHIRGAQNIPLPDLAGAIPSFRGRETVVFYSNGMTHPAQACDALRREGLTNVFLLTDGLEGFMERCLKPVSLRGELVPATERERIRAWRSWFLQGTPPSQAPITDFPPSGVVGKLPGLIDPAWVEANLGNPLLKIIDTRPQPEYNSSHIPGALSLQPDNLRGMVGGVPSMLLPGGLLVRHFSSLGLAPRDFVVLVHGEKLHDATLVGLALERIGHDRYAVLDGGFKRWTGEKRRADNVLPRIAPSAYPDSSVLDPFTIGGGEVLQTVKSCVGCILDVRPEEAYLGKKVEEARGGHIPGAINRPYTTDLDGRTDRLSLLPLDQLAAAYGAKFPDKEKEIIVHCRTGHQASQAYFILKHLLGYRKVRWYDGGWTEWAARLEFPVSTTP